MDRASRGFSLTEMVVVLAVLILLMAIIIPTIGPMRRRARMRAAVASVAGALRLARSMAIAQSAVYSVDFETGPDPDEVRIHSGGKGKDNPDRVERLPELVGILTPAPTIFFRQDGSCLNSPTVTVRNRSGDEYVIRVSPASGQVRASKVTK